MRMKKRSKKNGGDRGLTPRAVQLFILMAASVVFCGYFIANESSAGGFDDEVAPVENAAQDYSRFRHSTPQHDRMPCLLCHKREDNSAAIRFPGHMPCAGCHVQQFADNKHPICTICHTATSVKRFPGLRSFNSKFDHAKHSRQTNCATCHRPLRAGVALSIPAGTSAHQTCFTCHGPRTEVGGRNIGSCSVCHQPGSPTRNTAAARAFQVNFSHSEHGRRDLSCSACHTIRAGAGRGRQVTAPTAAMHFAPAGTQSCASCHNNRRAFGGNDFADCKQCHERNTFKF